MSARPAEAPDALGRAGRRRELARVLRRRRRLRAGVVQLIGAVLALGLAFLMPQIPVGFELPTARVTEARKSEPKPDAQGAREEC
jgi:hypothetical protein